VATIRVMHDLGCACGRHFRRPLFHALDVTEQPGLRYALLAGVLNVAQCPSCERIATIDVPFLYDDEARGHLFQVYPLGMEMDALGPETVRAIADALATPMLDDSRRAAVIHSLEPLVELIGDELDDDEQPGSVLFDVRPGITSERAARRLAEQIAANVDGYVHSWREGGRLHLDVMGPSARLETIRVVSE